MRNLQFQFSFSPDAVYLSSQALRYYNKPLQVSTTNHLVLNLLDVTVSPKLQGQPMYAFVAGCPACDAEDRGQTTNSKKHTWGLCPRARKPRELKEEPPAQPEQVANPEPAADDDAVQEQAEQAEPAEHPEAEAEPAGPAPNLEPQAGPPLPLPLRRIHEKLSKDTELLKLHLKHYHMSTTQFRRRTSQLKLPETIYKRYDAIVRECEACRIGSGGPTRSRVSGLRATEFGDLVFVDHCEVGILKTKYNVLLALDAATSLLWCTVQRNREAETTVEAIREWMENFSCVPKSICADMAFQTPEFKRFFTFHNINPIATGPRTPWPNRAETAVRLFKKTFKILVKSLKNLPSESRLSGTLPSALSIAKETTWARNQSMLISGKTPIELAFGRAPPPLFNPETASPDQLTVDPLRGDLRANELKKLALQAHISATQLIDLRQDLARRLRPSEGPFPAGTKVFYWSKDQSKIKGVGRWIRGKVLSQTGSMVLIETSNAVVRVNQSKVKKASDEWHDVQIPLDPVPKNPTDANPPEREEKEEEAKEEQDQQADESADAQNAFVSHQWLCQGTGKLDFLELFSGSARLSQECARHKLKTGAPIDLKTGFDLLTKEGQAKAWSVITSQQPTIVFMAPVCTPFSSLRNSSPPEQVWQEQQAAMLLHLWKAWVWVNAINYVTC